MLEVPPVMPKVGAPDATMLYEPPEQITPLEALIVGLAFTDTVVTATFEDWQPPLVPVTE
jgi:hypothetical protein